MNNKKSLIIPPINNYSSRQEWETACWNKISKSKKLLSLFVTSYEKHNLVMRVAIMNRLALGKSYREIGKELWISSQTVSGIKKAVDEKSYRSYLARNERKKERI